MVLDVDLVNVLALSASEVSSASFLLSVDTLKNTDFPEVTIGNPRGTTCYFIAAVLSGILSLEAGRDSCCATSATTAEDTRSVFLRSMYQEIVKPLWSVKSCTGQCTPTLEITSEIVSRLLREAGSAGWLNDQPLNELDLQQDVHHCFEFLHEICGLSGIHKVAWTFTDKENHAFTYTQSAESAGSFTLCPTYDGGDQKVSLSVLVEAHFTTVEMIKDDRPTFQK
jgi:hypothetical protein